MLKLKIEDDNTIEDFYEYNEIKLRLESPEQSNNLSLFINFHSGYILSILDTEYRKIEFYTSLKDVNKLFESFGELTVNFNNCGNTSTFIINNKCIEVLSSPEEFTHKQEDEIMCSHEIYEVIV